MKKNVVSKFVTVAAALSMASFALMGCGSTTEEVGTIEKSQLEETIEETPVATAATEDVNKEVSAPYFTKGVYANYSSELENPEKHYFYVFSEDSYGYTDDSESGTGLPFDCRQDEGAVIFTFGGASESEEKLIVSSVENGMVYGYFEGAEDRPLVFELLADADPEGFNAQNYTSTGDYVYNDANGWSIKYDPKRFEITKEGPVVAIVYTGESAGANLIQVTYDVEHNGKEMRDEIAKGYGEKATTLDAPFTGTEDVQGYWAMVGPDGGGAGLYETAISRDYMDGSLTFECIEHMSGDEALDMEVSDYMAMIIDSVKFESYEN